MSDDGWTSATAPHEQPRTFPCDGCGASLTFKPGTDALECPHCGHRQVIASGERVIEEYDFRDALRRARTSAPAALASGGKSVRCEGCGAETVITGQSAHCAFCGAPVVLVQERDAAIFVPDSVLPFKIDARAAKERFDAWVRSRWFAPGDLSKRARAQGLDGVYLPYWTYDSRTSTRYSGQRGEHYYVSESYKDAEGKTQTRQVQRTRWYPASGVVSVDFDDVLVCASESLPLKLIEALEPWDLRELRPYDPGFLSGFVTERYKLGLEAGFRRAEERMSPQIEATIRRDIGGDEQRISGMVVHHEGVTFKHCLLPLWITSFRYHEKIFRVTVNARTGGIAGERPYSAVKIASLVILLIAVVVGIVFLTRGSR
ncbi:MAG: hypothetical protein IPK80_33750 [Nannocystis sp.]|nr:hypothetical protein [Nannocystis sp.]